MLSRANSRVIGLTIRLGHQRLPSSTRTFAMATSTTDSAFASAAYIPPDAIFELTRCFQEDPSPRKVNLGQGTYRDESGNPWVLPSVRAAKKALGSTDHEYLHIRGLPAFCESAARLVFHGTKALKENHIATCQALSGTGSLLLAGLTLKRATNIRTVYVTSPSWSNHQVIFSSLGFTVKQIPYYTNRAFDFAQYMNVLTNADEHSAVILHACAHNPTGCDPTRDQWRQITDVIQQRGVFPIFDAAYLGFNSGSVDEDAWAIRHLTDDAGLEAAVCTSFAKNMGLYGERVGLVAFVTKNDDARRTVSSILEREQRATVSSPPAYGAKIAAAVLGDPGVAAQWARDLVTMSDRIRDMRGRLHGELVRMDTPGEWEHVAAQTGMFAYTGISRAQVHALREKYHIYMPDTGRLSLPGLNEGNVLYVAESLDSVLRTVPGRWQLDESA